MVWILNGILNPNKVVAILLPTFSKPEQNRSSHYEFYHLKTEFIKRLDFKYVGILNVQYSSPHCISVTNFQFLANLTGMCIISGSAAHRRWTLAAIIGIIMTQHLLKNKSNKNGMQNESNKQIKINQTKNK